MTTNSPQRLGQTMIYVAWILALILLTWFFNLFLERQSNPNQKIVGQQHADGSREVTLQRNQGGHYVATGTINGMPVVFLLDTGATMIALPEHIANQLRLEKGVPIQMVTANGTVTSYSTQLERVALGPIELNQVSATINPHMQEDEVLLGMSFLKKLEFTQRGDILILRQNKL